jgi:hypothetical protein
MPRICPGRLIAETRLHVVPHAHRPSGTSPGALPSKGIYAIATRRLWWYLSQTG